jgi:uncharacterized protein with FMN-binding domain
MAQKPPQRSALPPPARRPGPATSAPKAKSGGAKNKKIANSLVALGSAAIISVYGLGYVRTDAAQALYNVDAPSVAIATAAPTATATPSSVVAVSQSPLFSPTVTAVPSTATTATATSAAQSPATATTTGSGATAALYKDGTYTGTGTSRHGSIAASVVVQGGKIISAAITQCGTRYPCSDIAALPGEVVSRQSAVVDLVSGATDSSQAYRGAIQNALAKAKVTA